MTLKENFEQYAKKEVWEKENYNAEECVSIAHEFAIKFNDWVNENAYKYPTQTTTKELLEIYDKSL
jgi:pyruvate-formate lyase-activating enzyme